MAKSFQENLNYALLNQTVRKVTVTEDVVIQFTCGTEIRIPKSAPVTIFYLEESLA